MSSTCATASGWATTSNTAGPSRRAPLLGDRLPEVLIQLSIAADGRVTDARVLKPSGVKAMDESIKRLLANLDRVPTPPNGKVTFQLVMRTE
ncbi:MAG: TonB C-terminal domain-containing protein [Lentisphaeria bacterium]|nr:MAG: TonB C-terminal domain-containing protein [Lentisphaeria bacterium]